MSSMSSSSSSPHVIDFLLLPVPVLAPPSHLYCIDERNEKEMREEKVKVKLREVKEVRMRGVKGKEING